MPLKNAWTICSPYGWIVGQTGLFSLEKATSLEKEKLWIQIIFTHGGGVRQIYISLFKDIFLSDTFKT